MALTREENDLITQTGPGTPCGEFMRRYWHPIALAEELPADGPPVPVRLLGEDFVLFRDGAGRLGLLFRFCSHRAWDLAAGYPEEEGLRCAGHGWLYDRAGNCLEMPLEPPETDFRAEIKHRAYPVEERGGLVFAYIGPDEAPSLPAYEFLAAADDHRRSTKYFQDCNYLQGSEATLDPLVIPVLQRVLSRSWDSPDQNLEADDTELAVSSEETSFGLLVRANPTDPAASEPASTRTFIMPSVCGMAASGMDGYTVHWHVPIDDTRHWRFVIAVRRDAPLSDDDARQNGALGVEGYRLDREEIARVLHEHADAESNFVAFTTALSESQGKVVDRSQESLADGDAGIILMRKLIYSGIADVAEGHDPLLVTRPGEDAPEVKIAT